MIANGVVSQQNNNNYVLKLKCYSGNILAIMDNVNIPLLLLMLKYFLNSEAQTSLTVWLCKCKYPKA